MTAPPSPTTKVPSRGTVTDFFSRPSAGSRSTTELGRSGADGSPALSLPRTFTTAAVPNAVPALSSTITGRTGTTVTVMVERAALRLLSFTSYATDRVVPENVASGWNV